MDAFRGRIAIRVLVAIRDQLFILGNNKAHYCPVDFFR